MTCPAHNILINHVTKLTVPTSSTMLSTATKWKPSFWQLQWHPRTFAVCETCENLLATTGHTTKQCIGRLLHRIGMLYQSSHSIATSKFREKNFLLYSSFILLRRCYLRFTWAIITLDTLRMLQLSFIFSAGCFLYKIFESHNKCAG